jgi:hypothetical protein
MAIINVKVSEEGRQVVQREVGKLHQVHHALGKVRMEEVTIIEPHGHYVVDLADLVSGHLLSPVRFNSWRYVLLHGTGVVGTAELRADEKNGKVLKFGALYDTAFGKETLEALQAAEKLPQIGKQDYEPRFLDIPAVYFVAVWLHGKSDDILIPLPPTFGRWNAYQPYSERQMMKLLKKHAECAKNFDETVLQKNRLK